MTSIRSRLAAQDGWAVVTAIGVLAIILGLSLTTFSVVQTQTEQSGVERTRESSFNLAEGALSAQIFALSRRWPASANGTPPAADRVYGTCTAGSGTDPRCPRPTDLRSVFSNRDTQTGVTWRTNVFDNAGESASFYDDAVTPLQPGWDSNDDDKLWVRAQATVRGRTRTLIALVGVQNHLEELPRVALIAGSLTLTNSGKKVMVDANGDGVAYQPGIVAVRCPDINSKSCVDAPKFEDRFEPAVVQGGYDSAPAISFEARQRFKERAIADQTYYTSCAQAQARGLAGEVVYVDTSETCSFTGNAVWNTPERPGLLIWARGRVVFGGGVTYNGLLYHMFEDGQQPAITTQGNAELRGGVMIEGAGHIDIGSSKKNIVFDERASQNVRSYGTAGVIQNTWREIRPAS